MSTVQPPSVDRNTRSGLGRIAQHFVKRTLPPEDPRRIVFQRIHDQGGGRRHAHGAPVTSAVTEDGQRHVGAVPSIAVGGRRIQSKGGVDAGDPAGNVRVIDVQTGVDHGDGFARTVEGE